MLHAKLVYTVYEMLSTMYCIPHTRYCTLYVEDYTQHTVLIMCEGILLPCVVARLRLACEDGLEGPSVAPKGDLAQPVSRVHDRQTLSSRPRGLEFSKEYRS